MGGHHHHHHEHHKHHHHEHSIVHDWFEMAEHALEHPYAQAALGAAALTAAVFALAWAIKFVWNYVRIRRALKAIPTAPGHNWLLGHVLQLTSCVKLGRGAWDVMEDWIKARGPVVKFRILHMQGIAVSDPASLKRVFQTGQKYYEKEKYLSFKPFLPILGTGLVTAEGALWQKQRLLIGPALRTDILDDIIPIAKEATDRLAVKFEKLRGTGRAVDVEEEFRLLTLQVIGQAVLSLGPEECDKVFPELYLPVMEEANRRVLMPIRMYMPLLPAWWQFRSRMSKLNAYLINYMRQRWQARLKGVPRARTDILDRVLDAIQESGAAWDKALEQQLCYELKTFLLAGHETSAAMLTWSVFELARRPDVQAQICEEASRVWGHLAPGQVAARREVDSQIYTLAVLKEALRKYSVVPVVTRVAIADDELHGYKIPKGTMVVTHLQGAHNSGYAEPSQFKPERFMPGGEYDSFDEAERLYKFVPFIQGPRNCLGQHMALLEARVVLGLLAARFKFRTAHSNGEARCPLVVPVGPVDGMDMYID